MPTVTEAIAGFIAGLTLETLPEAVAAKARACLLNGYGIGLGCLTTPYTRVARQAALAMDGERPSGATLLGDGRRTSIAGAALANAALFHGRAQEDTCGAAHLGAIMIPLLTAVIEARGLPCDRLLPALVAGYEAGGLLEHAYGRTTTPAGLRATPLYGAIAAAAAVGCLIDLRVPELAAALANAASFSGGILQSFADGTDEWRYQVGMTGIQGLNAVELARAGSVSAPHAIEGRSGFVRAFVRRDCEAAELLSSLGRDWSIHRVTFKPYPVCAFNQTPVMAALSMAEEIAGRPIAAVEVEMNPFECGYAGMDATGPFSSISGTLMSIPFCIAATLLRGTPTMRMMTTYDDAEVNALVGRTELKANPDIAILSCRITVVLADGSRIRRDEIKTTADFSFDWPGVSALVRRVGGEIGVTAQTYDRLERFVANLPEGRVEDVVSCFAADRQ
ncbi:MAG TPA: MmgE/PrpD family protein [Terriglobia bacterium]|nr:MmgE/PrpD family protein [Terriglobia bacterium]